MPERGEANIEIAHHLNEARGHERPRLHLGLEAVEGIILALVAITTAWSGYQSARWDSVQAVLYGQSFRLRVEGQTLESEANQLKLYNAMTIVEWLKAEARGETKLAELFERRMVPEYRPAFEVWKQTDPLHNPNAPAGPFATPEFQDLRTRAAAKNDLDAAELFERGTQAREHADEYVRVTVFLATVLLLVALSQRFHSHRIRLAMATIALIMLCTPIWRLITLPRV